eukprot:3131609-Pleurochrysis_carterae.AAC.2
MRSWLLREAPPRDAQEALGAKVCAAVLPPAVALAPHAATRAQSDGAHSRTLTRRVCAAAAFGIAGGAHAKMKASAAGLVSACVSARVRGRRSDDDIASDAAHKLHRALCARRLRHRHALGGGSGGLVGGGGDAQEDLVQRRDGEPVIVHAQIVELLIQLGKERRKLVLLTLRQREANLGGRLGLESRQRHVLRQHCKQLRKVKRLRGTASERQLVAGAELRLQEAGRSGALQPASVQNGHTVAQRVRLVEKVRGQHDGAAGLGGSHCAPRDAARAWVHPCRRLVQQQQPRTANKRTRERELSLLPARE